MSKKTTKQRNRQIKINHEVHTPYHSEGIWEELNLEPHSYWDIDMLEKINAKTNKGIKYWEKRYAEASSWLGKWYCQIRIDKLKEKLHHYESKP
jgi:hypothetical protein